MQNSSVISFFGGYRFDKFYNCIRCAEAARFCDYFKSFSFVERLRARHARQLLAYQVELTDPKRAQNSVRAFPPAGK